MPQAILIAFLPIRVKIIDYNLNGIFFHDLSLDDPDVYMDAVGDGLGETMGNIIPALFMI